MQIRIAQALYQVIKALLPEGHQFDLVTIGKDNVHIACSHYENRADMIEALEKRIQQLKND